MRGVIYLKLTIIETHPIQYHAPVWRALQQRHGLDVTVIYGSDFSVAGYLDRGFGATFSWDGDLLSGYTSAFLSRTADGGATSAEAVSARGLRRALESAEPDAVLLTGYSPRFHRQALAEARRLKRPILFRAETTDHAVRRCSLKSWIRDVWLNRLYAACARLLYIGRRSRDHYLRLGVPQDKLEFSPYAVDGSTFESDETARALQRTAARRELEISKDALVVLFSGKLSHRKGADHIIRAVRRMDPHVREQITLIFLGDGELRRELERLVREPPSIDARFVGFRNQKQLSPFYHAADLLALPSHSETWGLVVNEALLHGLPCVVSDAVGCAPDLIELGVTGEACAAGSPQSLGEAIRRARTLVGRPEIRRACREKVGEYSVERAAEGIARAFFEATIGGRRPAPI